MKRTLKILAIITALCAILAISAFAADFEHCADSLSDLGLFKGTANGYELDREPIRAEAATMLVRLLGAEEEALALTYTAPFTDVADWAKPYVQYLYDNGLTKGTGDVTFGYSDPCSAQQYATFLLRALGYSDNAEGDFTYAEALSFAEEVGVVDYINCNEENFLRDHVVAMSYTALATAPKSGEADLLTKLVADGAIADAKGYDEFFANYRAFIESSKGYENETKLSTDMEMTISMKLNGADYMTIAQTVAVVADADIENMDNSKMSYSGELKAEMSPEFAEEMGVSEEERSIKTAVDYYYTDGYMYMNMQGMKRKVPMSYEDAAGTMGTVDMQQSSNPITMIKSIDIEKAADGTETYSVTCSSDSMNSLVGNVTEDLQDIPQYNDMAMKIEMRGGKLVSMSVSADMTTGDADQNLEITMNAKLTNIKTGDGVTVTLPTDLDTYV